MQVYGLIDGNSFYCSCEAAFDPKLRGMPVVVLSNNDGCAIARSAVAKALGIKMGDPWHLIRSKREMQGVHWYSSNFALYGDVSRRVFQVLAERVPRAEPYSIDETFLDLSGLPGNLHDRCRQLRSDVLRITKIPTCLGYGPTKVVALYGVALSTLSDEHPWAFAHESRTHGLDQTNWDGAASPVTFRDKWRSYSSASWRASTTQGAIAGACPTRPASRP